MLRQVTTLAAMILIHIQDIQMIGSTVMELDVQAK